MSDNPAVKIYDEILTLLPQKAIYWKRENTLLISDTHFGKTSTFLQHGISIPQSNTAEDLKRITELLNNTSSTRIIFLGDFFHAKCGKSENVLTLIKQWRESHKKVKLLLVRGNHDLSSGDPPDYLEIKCCNEPCIESPFVFKHNPLESSEGYTIAGHVHPSVKLKGKGRQGMRLSCFYFGRTVAVMPAFGSFTGMFTVSPEPDDKVFVIAGEKVLSVNNK